MSFNKLFDKINEERFKVGDKVKVSDGSGPASGKTATVVDKSKIKINGRGIPTNVQGAYKPVNWSKEVAIEYDGGKFDTIYKNRIHKVEESIVNEDVTSTIIKTPDTKDLHVEVSDIRKNNGKIVSFTLKLNNEMFKVPGHTEDVMGNDWADDFVDENGDFTEDGLRDFVLDYIQELDADQWSKVFESKVNEVKKSSNYGIILSDWSDRGDIVDSIGSVISGVFNGHVYPIEDVFLDELGLLISRKPLSDDEVKRILKKENIVEHTESRVNEDEEDTKWRAFGQRGPLSNYIISNAPPHRTKLAGYLDALHVIRNNFVTYANLSEFGKYIRGEIETAALKLLNQYESGKKIKPEEDLVQEEPEESEFDEEGWKEAEEELRKKYDEGKEPDFNKDGEEAQRQKLVEDVQELIKEVPGIDRQDEEILFWALKNEVIYNQFPEDEVMIDALALLDMTGIEDKDIGDADDVGIKAYYLKYIMLPRAKKAYNERTSEVDEAKIEVPDTVKTFSIISPEMGDPGGSYWELKVNGKTYRKCKTREECYTELAKYKPVEAKESKVNEKDGLADKAGKKPDDFNKDQLEAGTKVEMEHTSDKNKAQKIAMDHLTEDPEYYKKLKKMEAGACNESMNDPTREDMINSLKDSIFSKEDGFEDDAEVAMYWFANHFHGGQWSNLYSVLSTSPYEPGPNMTIGKENDMVQDIYNELIHEFSPKHVGVSVDEANEPESDFYTVNPHIIDKREADELAKKIEGVVITNSDHSFSVIKKKGSK